MLRIGIDKYYADKGEYPAALGDLVTYQYFRAVPVDPVTETDRTWQPVTPQNADKGGIADVRSGARGKTRDGIPYSQL